VKARADVFAEKAFQLPQSLPITPARFSGHPEQ
jgi:hypothetical protein